MGIVAAHKQSLLRQSAEAFEKDARERREYREGAGLGHPSRTVVRINGNYLRPKAAKLVMPGTAPGGSWKRYGVDYEVDAAAEELAGVLARKNWQVPGVFVEMRIADFAGEPLAVISGISGGASAERWRVAFGRVAFENDPFLLTTAVANIQMPGQELKLYSDGSGPTLYRYCGSNWAEDEEAFFDNLKIDAKLRGEKRTYLRYSGNGLKMINEGDFDREYRASGDFDEPFTIPKQRMFEDFEASIRDIVDIIDNRYPDSPVDGEGTINDLLQIEPIPVPKGTPELIAIEGILSTCVCAPEDFRGCPVCYSHVRNDYRRPFSERAYDPFVYARPASSFTLDDKVYGFDPLAGSSTLFEVRLAKANDIFVADHDAYEAALQMGKQHAEAAGRRHMNSDELDYTHVVLARTMVPLSEYKGNYGRPVYLIGRPLDETEAVDVSAKWPTAVAARKDPSAVRIRRIPSKDI